MRHYPFPNDAEERERLRLQSGFYAPATRSFLTSFESEGVQRILDLGTGIGGTLPTLVEHFGKEQKLEITCMDLDPTALEEAALVAESLKPRASFTFVNQRLEHYEPTELFDLAFARCFLMYFDDPAEMVRKIARLVRPGGFIVIQDADHTSYCRSEPPSPVYDGYAEEILAMGSYCEVQENLGLRLAAVFREAGIQPVVEHRTQRHDSGPDSPAYDVLARTILGMRRQSKLLSRESPDVVPLEQLTAELKSAAVGCTVFSSTLIGVAGKVKGV